MLQILLKAQWLGNYAWLNEVYNVLPNILYAILAIVGGAGSVYAIVLGVNLAKSENEEKRKGSLFRLRNTLIGVACLLVLVLFINLALPAIFKQIPGAWGEISDADTAINLLVNLI